MLIPLQRIPKHLKPLLIALIPITHLLPHATPIPGRLDLVLIRPLHERLVVATHVPGVHVRIGSGVAFDPVVGHETCVGGAGEVLAEDVDAGACSGG